MHQQSGSCCSKSSSVKVRVVAMWKLWNLYYYKCNVESCIPDHLWTWYEWSDSRHIWPPSTPTYSVWSPESNDNVRTGPKWLRQQLHLKEPSVKKAHFQLWRIAQCHLACCRGLYRWKGWHTSDRYRIAAVFPQQYIKLLSGPGKRLAFNISHLNKLISNCIVCRLHITVFRRVQLACFCSEDVWWDQDAVRGMAHITQAHKSKLNPRRIHSWEAA